MSADLLKFWQFAESTETRFGRIWMQVAAFSKSVPLKNLIFPLVFEVEFSVKFILSKRLTAARTSILEKLREDLDVAIVSPDVCIMFTTSLGVMFRLFSCL